MNADINSHRGHREHRAPFRVISFKPQLFCEQIAFIALGDIQSELLHRPKGSVCCLKRHAVLLNILLKLCVLGGKELDSGSQAGMTLLDSRSLPPREQALPE